MSKKASAAMNTKRSAIRGSNPRFPVIIAAQRRGETPESLIERVLVIVDNQPLALAAIGYTELVHGAYRGDTAIHRKNTRIFLDEVTRELPILPYTKEVAELAGRIAAEQRMAGYAVPSADLLIGATALHHGFAILTANVRHFSLIPGLEVIPF